MTRQDAINWANSKIGQYLDYDGLFGTQCVDFFNYYYEHVAGLKPYAQGLGVNYAYQLAAKRPGGLTWVQNNPADKNQFPSNGDIIVMSGTNGFGGGAGHVGVSMNTDTNAVRMIDETPNTKVAARQYQWTNVLGWFVPNTFNQAPQGSPQGGNEDMITPQDRDLVYKLTKTLKLWGDPIDMDKEMKAWTSQDWRRFLSEGMNEASSRFNQLVSAEKDLETLRNQPPQVVEKVVEKIVEKPVEVIKEVVKEVFVEVPVEAPTQPMTWASVLDFLRDQINLFLRRK